MVREFAKECAAGEAEGCGSHGGEVWGCPFWRSKIAGPQSLRDFGDDVPDEVGIIGEPVRVHCQLRELRPGLAGQLQESCPEPAIRKTVEEFDLLLDGCDPLALLGTQELAAIDLFHASRSDHGNGPAPS